MCVERNIEAHSRYHCSRAKSVSIAYPEHVSIALIIQQAKRMRRLILSSVTYLNVPYYCILCPKRHYFRKIEHEMYVFSLQQSSKTFLISRIIP
jgi:hypothetical protein